MDRKETKKYYFSVEGETEELYLEWLKNLINSTPESKYLVSLNCKVEKDPIKRAKSLVSYGQTTIYHFSDYESDDEVHVRQFHATMDRLKETKKLGKQIVYHFGYSNLTFDLWIVLHKCDCNGFITHRSNYVANLNTAYTEHFENMGKFKKEDNFKRCLQKLDLSNVKNAIYRAKEIMRRNKENGLTLHEYKGYHYYQENPSLAVWEPIEQILIDCGLL